MCAIYTIIYILFCCRASDAVHAIKTMTITLGHFAEKKFQVKPGQSLPLLALSSYDFLYIRASIVLSVPPSPSTSANVAHHLARLIRHSAKPIVLFPSTAHTQIARKTKSIGNDQTDTVYSCVCGHTTNSSVAVFVDSATSAQRCVRSHEKSTHFSFAYLQNPLQPIKTMNIRCG